MGSVTSEQLEALHDRKRAIEQQLRQLDGVIEEEVGEELSTGRGGGGRSESRTNSTAWLHYGSRRPSKKGTQR